MKFKELNYTDVFEFTDGLRIPIFGLVRGPWVRTSPRKYRPAKYAHDFEKYENEVGSINVEVTIVEVSRE